VHLPGGELTVSLEGGTVRLVGPAQEICSGKVSPELLAGVRGTLAQTATP
jgi:hypothetical protein